MEKPKFYITTPIYYPSGNMTIGHTYTTVAADSMTRFKKMTGYDTYFLTGTDEHGQKIERKAEEAGVTPKQFVDKIVAETKDLWKLMNIQYDDFIRTTDERHQKVVQKIFKKFYEQGDIYKGAYEGYYCTPCESFWTVTQLKEKDGQKVCPDCGRPVELSREECYFFKMSKYQDWIIDYIETHPDFIQPPSRANEMLNNFLRPGLQDLCVSRTSFKWGVPVDFDPGHVVYVWIDALSNYISALGYLSDDDSLFKKYWPADIHLVGKEIVRFHTIYWPIMLHALGLPLPRQVFGHGWLLFGGDKMSKSKGNVEYPAPIVGRYGTDVLRYYLMREMPFGADGNYTNEALLNRMNSDLCNDLGNLVSRTVAMIKKYFGGAVALREGAANEGTDEDFKAVATSAAETVIKKGDELRIADALSAIMAVFRRANKYIDETAPWVLAKDEANKDRLNDVLYNLSQAITTGASLLSPFLPGTSEKILAAFGAEERTFEECGVFAAQKTVTVTECAPLFARADMKQLLPEIEKIRAQQIAAAGGAAEEGGEKNAEKKKMNEEKTEKEAEEVTEISLDDFEKVRLQVGEIVACEKVEKSSKLLHETVKFGDETRSVVSGIAKHFKPEELIGKKVVFVTNLKPVKLCGVLSEGMILAAEDADGKFSLICPESDVNDGTRLG